MEKDTLSPEKMEFITCNFMIKQFIMYLVKEEIVCCNLANRRNFKGPIYANMSN